MHVWKKVLAIHRASRSRTRQPWTVTRRVQPPALPCIWCLKPSTKATHRQAHGKSLAFDVCSDECDRKIARLFAPGTVIYDMIPSLASGAAVALPKSFGPEIARIKESIERQLKNAADEGPLELLDA